MYRPKLAELFKSCKDIRTGKKELEFIGVLDKSRNGNSILLLNIQLADTLEVLTDHVWLSYRGDWGSSSYSSFNSLVLLGSKKNRKVYSGRKVLFTARIMTYDFTDKDYGLYFTPNSRWDFLR